MLLANKSRTFIDAQGLIRKGWSLPWPSEQGCQDRHDGTQACSETFLGTTNTDAAICGA